MSVKDLSLRKILSHVDFIYDEGENFSGGISSLQKKNLYHGPVKLNDEIIRREYLFGRNFVGKK